MSNIQHKDLITKALKADEPAMRKLYSLYATTMLNTAHRIVGRVDEAEDIMQESFIKAFSNLHQFNFSASFGAWMKRIVINKSIDALKKKKRLVFEPLDKNSFKISSEIYIESTDTKSKVDQIYTALHQLPDGYRTVFSLYLLEGYDHKEIAQILGIKKSTSISQLSRAKKKVIQLMEKDNLKIKR